MLAGKQNVADGEIAFWRAADAQRAEKLAAVDFLRFVCNDDEGHDVGNLMLMHDVRA
jgi:hypothetical protein